MLASHLRSASGLLLASLCLTFGLIGPSCQNRAGDCNETLSCETGGGDSGGNGTGGGQTTGGAAQGGMGGEGGMGGLGGSSGGGTGGDGSGGMMPCDPSQEECTSETIVHVSPDGDDTADGSAEAPIASLGEALVRVAALVADGEEMPMIYLCATAGPFQETLTLGAEHGALGIFGGFDCEGFVSGDVQTVLVAAEPSGHRIEGATGVRLGDLQLESPNASEPGESSVALTVVDSTGILIARTDLVAGEGAPGAPGMGYSEPAAEGTDGNPGVNACVYGATEVSPGGPAAVTTCGALTSTGGKGGLGGGGIAAATGGDGDPGTPDGGPAGKGEDATECENGDTGEAGSAGNDGTLSPQFGGIDEAGYTPPVGGNGTPGEMGRGGGGGGGAALPVGCDTGASGGSGGGGGCPGAGAEGGQGGGGSFGLISVGSSLELIELGVVVALGGAGGVGGNRQLGGARGDGASGGLADGYGVDACSGGDGGSGGRGGSGAGGAGGPSVGVAFVGMEPLGLGDVAVDRPSTGADGGPGGIQHVLTGAGPAGLSADTWSL